MGRKHVGRARRSLEKIARRYELTETFERAVLAEVEAIVESPGIDDPTLEDLTSLAFITIDNDDSKDLDQAMCIERIGKGFRLHYALADASYFVRPDTKLFDEALRRGATYYFVGFSIPMLPRVLCEDLVSLNEAQLRRAMVMSVQLDESARVTSSEIRRARVRSRAKLSYRGVQQFYDAPKASPLGNHPYTETLELLRALGTALIDREEKRDVVRYRRDEVQVSFSDASEERFSVRRAPRMDVERYNEQISLLCNTEGGRILEEAGGDPDLQAIFRVHPKPPEQRVVDFAKRVESIVSALGLDAETFSWKRGTESLADYLARLPEKGHGWRVAQAIHQQAIMINEQSVFDEDPGPHYGIGAEQYARFTSPMREVVGIFTHKEAFELLDKDSEPRSPQADEKTRKQVVNVANEAKALQKRIDKDIMRLVIDQSLEHDVRSKKGKQRQGTIVGLSKSKIYVELDEPPIEVKLYTAALERVHDQTFELDEDAVALRGSKGLVLHLGAHVRIRALEHEYKGRWSFEVLQAGESA